MIKINGPENSAGIGNDIDPIATAIPAGEATHPTAAIPAPIFNPVPIPESTQNQIIKIRIP